MNFTKELLQRSQVIHVIYPDKTMLELEKTTDNNFLVSDTTANNYDTVPFDVITAFVTDFLNQDDLEILFIAYDGEIFEHVKPRKGVPL